MSRIVDHDVCDGVINYLENFGDKVNFNLVEIKLRNSVPFKIPAPKASPGVNEAKANRWLQVAFEKLNKLVENKLAHCEIAHDECGFTVPARVIRLYMIAQFTCDWMTSKDKIASYGLDKEASCAYMQKAANFIQQIKHTDIVKFNAKLLKEAACN